MKIKLLFYIFLLINSKSLFAEKEYQFDLAICTVFRDDAPYLEEWIEFHRMLGVEHFFLYNHLSKDDFTKVLDPYIREGIVDLIDWSRHFPSLDHTAWITVQTQAFNHAIQTNKEKCRWIAFIDTDEFLFPAAKDNLVDFLKDYEDFGGLCVSWRLFGTSHVPYIPPGELMIQKLTLAGNPKYHLFHKSIVNPRCVNTFKQVHAALYHPPYFHVDAKKVRLEEHAAQSRDLKHIIRINHYWTRDESYFYDTKLVCRQRRGWVTEQDIKRAEILNSHIDISIQRFIPALKERILERRRSELQKLKSENLNTETKIK